MKTINILILDDKEENIISLNALLEDVDNINIISCTDPNEALKICWKDDISIALVDVQMPEINGFEFVSLLKSNPKTSHIMAIMVTAISKEDKFLLKGLESGAVDYLYKPLNPEITIAKVKSFVQQILIQQELIQKNKELEESKIELLKTREEAIQARKSKEIFLANMSHEIRTPINGIMGIMHMFKSSELSTEQKDWLRRLDNASHSLLLIINDILDLSKIDSGMLKIEYEDFSLTKMVEDINRIYRIKANHKDLEFEVEMDDQTPQYIRYDSLRLQQIISNFISNSLKFTESGKIVLKIKVLEVNNGNYNLRFSVHDTGIGIKEDSVEKIFLAFEQADDGITKKFGGTGLGLAIVKRLAKLLNGEVGASSEYGKGSEFYFEGWFEESSHEKEHIEKEVPTYNSFPKFEKMKVLVAEDNELNSFMLAHMLRSWNCQVDIVKNGRLALEKVESESYDLILMDTHMPIMSGFEAIKEIKNHIIPEKHGIPIITISASVLEHEQAAAYQAGADGVIGKPFDPIELYQKIIQVTNKTKSSKIPL
ncbi:response regulator [Sphingobacterium lactis]|uniref:histidine kinase n=1 Tax=Sphingobacterium lactis TaxID=797291 RepID=A0A1H5RYS3_9SPHI|nr:response regulator [Sphingobacterium lactis]SEF42757.1 Signal transduction histidine kinase [Sphingobacterium lactis]